MLATGTRYAIVGVQLQGNELDYWLIVAIGGTLFGFIVGRIVSLPPMDRYEPSQK